VIGLLIPICGTVFASERSQPSEVGQWLIEALLILELPLVVGVVYRLTGTRLVAVLLTLPQVWFAAWAFLVNSMPKRGIWL